ncbi:hypothetical protein PHYBLDRAFT_71344 [Phycomyces blakesleeanus NRRL 1555(-)]|uniref:sn-1-specific diacylglycerol lipase n=1 Tax=Phycomyces blakesleeanus (strain ATCC 8743b / DSM 1359 / FGSC 10004 / NBRC 33097 / NRRL 1555) TaxID=763407 RepID=A0A167RDQ0_PHYB8|nr:hypothetical protein PHYBLDRAFT_71344 [Phycomyces blakesleeanus NRRL 1555(-)]OAD81424.1 hypothetical protein PHYBLDRAFT_71344 [Phycomyces blakesleeanus NRRL 1555(-)]|eukprot:XP_018299464.1 hypothetical protein PHYBLDRAFT_71344 [Phycomyces blakesleeanus NRRL 1555(-)]
MKVASHPLSVYHTSIYDGSPTLLPDNVANFISTASLATRLSLRFSSLFLEAMFDAAKCGTVLSLGVSRQALINAFSSAQTRHALLEAAPNNNINSNKNNNNNSSSSSSNETQDSGFLEVLERYTGLGIHLIHHTFTVAELFAMSGLQLTSKAVKTSLKAVEESVRVLDGIFGSSETSRAIAGIVTLMHREIMNDPNFELAKEGKIAILTGLTRAITTFAVLQSLTHQRTMKQFKMTVLWKGVVVEDEQGQQGLIQFHAHNPAQSQAQVQAQASTPAAAPAQVSVPVSVSASVPGTGNVPILPLSSASTIHTKQEDYEDIIFELQAMLASHEAESLNGAKETQETSHNNSNCKKAWPVSPLYEITATTNTRSTRTTRIRPIDTLSSSLSPSCQPNQPAAKYVVVQTDQVDTESFVAIIDREDESTGSSEWVWNDQLLEETECDERSNILLAKISPKTTQRHTGRSETCGYTDDNIHLQFCRQDPISVIVPIDHRISQTSTPTQGLVAGAGQSSMIDQDESKHRRRHNNNNHHHHHHRHSHHGNSSHSNYSSSDRRNKHRSCSSVLSYTEYPATTAAAVATATAAAPNITGSNSSHISSSRRSSCEGSQSSHSSNGSTTYHTIHTSTPPLFTNPSLSHHHSTSSLSSSSSTLSSSSTSSLHMSMVPGAPLDGEPSPHNFPRNHIINNIAHFMRYASAAYGESFMRILGIGDIPSAFPASADHPNHHAFAHHTGVPIQDILLSSYTDASLLSSMHHPSMHALVHYVAVDHQAKAIVLTCRGTLGLSDILTDLTCGYVDFDLPTDQPGLPPVRYRAHGGMLDAAQRLAAREKGRVFQTIRQGLQRYPEYGLVLCGHSLGGGVVGLLSVIWSERREQAVSRLQRSGAGIYNSTNPDSYEDMDVDFNFDLDVDLDDVTMSPGFATDPVPFVTSPFSGLPAGRPIHCYTYGPPCCMSLELSEYCGQGLVTSVVHGYDFVSGLSIGLLKDLKNVAQTLHTESNITDEIIGRLIGQQTNKIFQPTGPFRVPDEEYSEDDQWFWALIKTMRADMTGEKIYPPSTIYHIKTTPHSSHSRDNSPIGSQSIGSAAHTVVLSRCEDVKARFSEIIFTKSMFMDHSPNVYEKVIRQLCRGFFDQKGAYDQV